MLFRVDNMKTKQKNPVIRYKIASVLTGFTMLKPSKIKKKKKPEQSNSAVPVWCG